MKRRPAMPEPVCINRKIFDRLKRFDGGEIRWKIISIFFENAPKKIEAAMAGGKMKDYAAVAFAVHSLVSSAGTLGAVELQKLAQAIQDAAIHKRGKEVSRLLIELEPAYGRMKALLEKVLEL